MRFRRGDIVQRGLFRSCCCHGSTRDDLSNFGQHYRLQNKICRKGCSFPAPKTSDLVALTPYHFLKRSYEYDSLLGCIGPPYSEFLAQPQKDMFMWVKRNMSLAMPTWMRQGFCLNSLLEISEKMGQNREKRSKRRSYSYEYDNYRGCTM